MGKIDRFIGTCTQEETVAVLQEVYTALPGDVFNKALTDLLSDDEKAELAAWWEASRSGGTE